MHVAGMTTDYCAPVTPYNVDPVFMPVANTDSLLALYPDMPVHILIMANATGILPLMIALKKPGEDTFAQNALRSKVHHRIMLALSEIAGVAAELDCEGERAGQLGHYLDDFNSKRNTALTVASIVAGAITTVATATIKDDGTQNSVAIGGGLLSAGLGALTIKTTGKKMRWEHRRNLLADIWNTPAVSAIYPPFLWYVLNDKHFSNSGRISLAQSIRKRWMEYDLGGKVSAAEEKLFFGPGGIYNADDLNTRANMLNELQSTIRSVNQNLQSLIGYLARY